MQIAHMSIGADNPAQTARILADIMQGECVPFPPAGPEAWTAWSGDGEINFEVVLRGHTLHAGDEEGGWRPDPAAGRLSEVHAAIAVDRSEAEIIEIAQKAGWTARHCERGGGLFSLVEVWIDNAFMLEFLDPAQTAVYKERITLANWKAFLSQHGLMPAAA